MTTTMTTTTTATATETTTGCNGDPHQVHLPQRRRCVVVVDARAASLRKKAPKLDWLILCASFPNIYDCTHSSWHDHWYGTFHVDSEFTNHSSLR
jgi:hypothetical protein